jgi:hypothetical protein
MARDYISIGMAPADEDCAQVGAVDYYAGVVANSGRWLCCPRASARRSALRYSQCCPPCGDFKALAEHR